ncbi:hypothetical protein B0A68_09390 [Flavobacterium reichenbachii]|uniref:Uncharacterized protein n=1 Tax=Flavobacterium reichenbachii TaxID=362418 RepID=A0A085ZI30_9FLAO|nr:hypothetical protein IW19_00465 [Flavobacterium reichenbachii]OXB15863.1 hypothetical protein B0A68_09390 [Flavobacterium reichenbachii]
MIKNKEKLLRLSALILLIIIVVFCTNYFLVNSISQLTTSKDVGKKHTRTNRWRIKKYILLI